ncbi:hypothetical protein WN51_07969 [Melipona quadrifasciata]|uniref:Ig-like domain-containing protein n=1 Tax=Melipona quadrifasciata TaxID=166423 RepID=A0A0N0BC25_9HYME|nr:hypothetical protein WN51_07969 [Melipona quadrifasciata]
MAFITKDILMQAILASDPSLFAKQNEFKSISNYQKVSQASSTGSVSDSIKESSNIQAKWLHGSIKPPDIVDDESANGMVTHEGGEVKLKCNTTGSSKPTVTWKREDDRNIILRVDGQKQYKISIIQYEYLTIRKPVEKHSLVGIHRE